MELNMWQLQEFAQKIWQQKQCTLVQDIQNTDNEEISTKLLKELKEPYRRIYQNAQITGGSFLSDSSEWEKIQVYEYETKADDEIDNTFFVFYEIHFDQNDSDVCICFDKKGYGSQQLKIK